MNFQLKEWFNFRGERSPVPMLRLDGRLTNQSDAVVDATVRSFSMSNDSCFKFNGSSLPAVSRVERVKPGETIHFELPIPVSHSWIRETEDRRAGNGLGSLNVCLFVEYRSVSLMVLSSGAIDVLGAPDFCQVSEYYKVEQDAWRSVLSSLGYDEFEVFEVPIRKFLEHPDYKKALDTLREAQKHFRQGAWPAVVLRARVAVEQLAHVTAEKDDASTARAFDELFERIAPGKDNKYRRDALGKFALGLHDLRHMSPHGSFKGPPVDRVDAEFSLNVAIGLFRYYGERLARPLERG